MFGFGKLDLFGSRVSPIGAFDILGKGFSKIQLVLTLAALAVGTTLVAPFVSGLSMFKSPIPIEFPADKIQGAEKADRWHMESLSLICTILLDSSANIMVVVTEPCLVASTPQINLLMRDNRYPSPLAAL